MSLGKNGLTSSGQQQSPLSDKDFERLHKLLDSIKFGSVTLVIQDGKIVQMEKNEKVRLK
jgi:hypothetical protein